MARMLKWPLLILALVARASLVDACETPKCVNCSRKEFIDRVAVCAVSDVATAVLNNFPAKYDCLQAPYRNDHMEPKDGCLRDAMVKMPNARFQVPLLSIVNAAANQVGGRIASPTDRSLILFQMYASEMKSPHPALISALVSAGFDPRPYVAAVDQLTAVAGDATSISRKINSMPVDIRRMILATEKQHVATILNNPRTATPFLSLVIATLVDPDELLEFVAQVMTYYQFDPQTLDSIFKAISKTGNPPQLMASSLCILTDLVDRSVNIGTAVKDNQALFTALALIAKKASRTMCSLPGGKIEPDLTIFYPRVMVRMFGANFSAAPTIRYDQPATAALCSNSDLTVRVKEFLRQDPLPANSNAYYNDAKGCMVNLTVTRQPDGGVLIAVVAAAQRVIVPAPKPTKDNIEEILKKLPWSK